MRVSAKPIQKYPLYLRPLFWLQKRNHGEILLSALVWARSPKVFLALSALYGALDRKSSPLEPALRSLITVRVSQINNCSFCVDINSALLIKRGVTIKKIEALSNWRKSKLFSNREKAVLTYVEAMTDSRLKVSAEAFETLNRYFGEDEIVELTGLIAFQNMSSKFNAALNVPAQGFCRIPTQQKSPSKQKKRSRS